MTDKEYFDNIMMPWLNDYFERNENDQENKEEDDKKEETKKSEERGYYDIMGRWWSGSCTYL